jgi:acyl carrier protein
MISDPIVSDAVASDAAASIDTASIDTIPKNDPMAQDDIRETALRMLIAHIKLDIDPAEIADDRSTDSLGLSSLKLMNLMYDLEEAFAIELDPEEMLGLTTVGDIVAALRDKMAGRDGARAA